MKLCRHCGKEISAPSSFCPQCGKSLTNIFPGFFHEVPSYSTVRRIWRVIYPPIIFFAMQFVVIFIATIVYAVYISIQEAAGGAIDIDIDRITAEVMTIMLDNVLLITLIAFVACLAVFWPMWHVSRKKMPKYIGNNMTAANISLTVIMSICAYFIIIGIIGLLDLTRFFPSHDIVEGLFEGSTLILQILAVGLIGPIVEELCFRGIVFTRLLYWMPVWAALTIQGALFGIAHMNLLQGMYAFVLGVFLGWLYVRFRTLWLPIIGHVVFNMMPIILTRLVDDADVADIVEEAAGISNVQLGALIILIPAAVVFAVCLGYMLKLPKAKIPPPSDDAPPLWQGGQERGQEGLS